MGLSEVIAAVKLLLPVNVMQDAMPHMETAVAEFEKTKNLKPWQQKVLREGKGTKKKPKGKDTQ